MSGSISYNVWVDRDTGAFDFSISYMIDAYIDPETGEYFGNTAWTVTYAGAPMSGYAAESEYINVNLGLAPGDELVQYTLGFSAFNTFSAASVSEEWNILVAGYSTIDLTANGGDDVDIIVTGFGNDTAFGNNGNDIINTGDGDDTLDGGDGADQLDGGLGDDTMIGGAGDDFYMVSSEGDAIVEFADGGNDVVMSSVSYTLGEGVEQLILNGFGPLVGTGNNANNGLYGNHDVNVLTGLDGNDWLYGYGGVDALYGGNGNDTLDGGTGDDLMEGGDGDDIYQVDAVGDTIVELAGGGTDTAVTFDLAAYTLADEVENLTVLWGGDFHGTGNDGDNVITGGTANDTLAGLGGADTLQGGAGDDTLVGGVGADRLVGEAGFDTASYADAADRVWLDMATGGTRGAARGDTFEGIERVVGSAYGDSIGGDANDNQLWGGGGDDFLDGGDGNDVLVGGVGADILNGGGGAGDWVGYVGSVGAVFVNLATDTVLGGDAEGDTIAGFANAAGGNGDDFLIGNAGANSLFGDAGDDFLFGWAGDDTLEGGAGADRLLGGSGTDLLSYASSAQAVTVDLAAGTVSGGDAGGDLFDGIEGAIGSALGDTLIAGPDGARLDGGAGDDTMLGGDGDDTIIGGTGLDVMNGGAGVDTLSYASFSGWVSISLPSSSAYEYLGTNDQIANFENVIGSAFGDSILGDEGANQIDGGGGGDYIVGFGGDDLITGGADDDFIHIDWSSGNDTILDFHAGPDMEDSIGLGLGYDFDTFAEVIGVAAQSGADTVLTFSPGFTLTLANLDMATLTEADFYFSN